MSTVSSDHDRGARSSIPVGVGWDRPLAANRRPELERSLLGTAEQALARYEHDYEPLPEPAEAAFVWGFCGAYAGGTLEEQALRYAHHDDRLSLELRGYALGFLTGDAVHHGRLPAYSALRAWLRYHDAGAVPQRQVKANPEL